MFPRYVKTHKSHCLYTRHWHLYIFHRQPEGRGWHGSGWTIKHRRHDSSWRITTWRMSTLQGENARLKRWEIATHISLGMKRNRVPGSKRYIRFKWCL